MRRPFGTNARAAPANSASAPLRHYVKVDGWLDIGQSVRPGINTGAALRIGVAGLELQTGDGGGEMRHMLAGAAGDFKRPSRRRKLYTQHLQNGVPVAQRAGCRHAGVL
jgi:hypothetical protein